MHFIRTSKIQQKKNYMASMHALKETSYHIKTEARDMCVKWNKITKWLPSVSFPSLLLLFFMLLIRQIHLPKKNDFIMHNNNKKYLFHTKFMLMWHIQAQFDQTAIRDREALRSLISLWSANRWKRNERRKWNIFLASHFV